MKHIILAAALVVAMASTALAHAKPTDQDFYAFNQYVRSTESVPCTVMAQIIMQMDNSSSTEVCGALATMSNECVGEIRQSKNGPASVIPNDLLIESCSYLNEQEVTVEACDGVTDTVSS